MSEPLIAITHTAADGTLLSGTSRGDGTAELIKPLGWRWGRQLGGWYLPRSRDVAPRHDLIATTEQALTAAGFVVELDVEDEVIDPAAAEQRFAERAEQRTQRLQERSDRHAAAAAQREAAGRRLSDGIPARAADPGRPPQPGAC